MLSTTLIAPLEIAKLVFFAVYVSATIGVVVGVYWEGDKFPKEKQQRGWRLLVGSLAVDTLFTILVFGTDGWVSAIQRGQIITLETRLAPRHLDDAAKERVATALRTFEGAVELRLSIIQGSKEASGFAGDLMDTFAKVPHIHASFMGNSLLLGPEPPAFEIAATSDLQQFAQMLAGALGKEGVVQLPVPFNPLTGAPSGIEVKLSRKEYP